MIIHSIVPHEHIFPADQGAFTNQAECEWNNIPLLVEQHGHKCKVVRIMSSNPDDFLKREIQPGSYIFLNEIHFY